MEHILTTYVRTKTLFQHRLKDLKKYDTVKIHVYELKKLGVNDGPSLYRLKGKELMYDDKGNFRALHDGPIDPALMMFTQRRPKIRAPLTKLHIYMMEQLMYVGLSKTVKNLPVYFKAFLDNRNRHLEEFFTVDAFSGRVHTPVVNLKGNLRQLLTLQGSRLVSLDVKQMQPLILAKVLLDAVGPNPFSNAIFVEKKDVYVMLQEAGNLEARSDAKKMLFQLIFGKPMDGIAKMFKGGTEWVDWINSYKSKTEHNNPHKEDKHTNLAWLLQYSEVQVMSGIWWELMKLNVPFVTIHDDILCKETDAKRVNEVMQNHLKKHFPNFEVIVTYPEAL